MISGLRGGFGFGVGRAGPHLRGSKREPPAVEVEQPSEVCKDPLRDAGVTRRPSRPRCPRRLRRRPPVLPEEGRGGPREPQPARKHNPRGPEGARRSVRWDGAAPSPPPRTNWTRLVPLPVLTGHGRARKAPVQQQPADAIPPGWFRSSSRGGEGRRAWAVSGRRNAGVSPAGPIAERNMRLKENGAESSPPLPGARALSRVSAAPSSSAPISPASAARRASSPAPRPTVASGVRAPQSSARSLSARWHSPDASSRTMRSVKRCTCPDAASTGAGVTAGQETCAAGAALRCGGLRARLRVSCRPFRPGRAGRARRTSSMPSSTTKKSLQAAMRLFLTALPVGP